jgi:hypothetical protein
MSHANTVGRTIMPTSIPSLLSLQHGSPYPPKLVLTDVVSLFCLAYHIGGRCTHSRNAPLSRVLVSMLLDFPKTR